ncbi:MAG TPA: hypothetical protein QGH10_06360 [Armatimonadota bacterium]|nr:hypothetical protein [Armatimonadota bacterium]
MEEIRWEEASSWDRNVYRGWEWVLSAAAFHLLLIGIYARDAQVAGVFWLLIGALCVIGPLAARWLGRRALQWEQRRDAPFIQMLAWRLGCFVAGGSPLIPAMAAFIIFPEFL